MLYRDLRTAEVLLHQKDARDLLWREYGIDGSDYLGTGYSVPLTGPTARNYEYALQREYFVPNLCAEAIDPAICPRKDANIWTWRLTAAQVSRWLDMPIAKFLHAHHPASDAAGFGKRTALNAPAVQGPLPNLLIRFGNLPLANYRGTFGRPGAVRVFFADYDLVRTKTLRGAVIATGAATLLDNSNPAKTFFIWIYAPDARSPATVASWNALFTILAQPRQ
jgi:hypothetical protein